MSRGSTTRSSAAQPRARTACNPAPVTLAVSEGERAWSPAPRPAGTGEGRAASGHALPSPERTPPSEPDHQGKSRHRRAMPANPAAATAGRRPGRRAVRCRHRSQRRPRPEAATWRRGRASRGAGRRTSATSGSALQGSVQRGHELGGAGVAGLRVGAAQRLAIARNVALDRPRRRRQLGGVRPTEWMVATRGAARRRRQLGRGERLVEQHVAARDERAHVDEARPRRARAPARRRAGRCRGKGIRGRAPPRATSRGARRAVTKSSALAGSRSEGRQVLRRPRRPEMGQESVVLDGHCDRQDAGQQLHGAGGVQGDERIRTDALALRRGCTFSARVTRATRFAVLRRAARQVRSAGRRARGPQNLHAQALALPSSPP